MNLIKIGNRIINLSLATNMNLRFAGSDNRVGIRIYFGAESETFYGAEARALEAWLSIVAIDVIEQEKQR